MAVKVAVRNPVEYCSPGFSFAKSLTVTRTCERGDLNPYALRHRILSPARLPFRHSRVLSENALNSNT